MPRTTGRLTKLESDRLKAELVEWLVLDKASRRAWRLPGTLQEWADAKGITTRTIRRWREDPKFDRRLAQRRTEAAQQAPGSTVAPKTTGYGAGPANAPERLDPVEPGSHPELVGLNLDDPGLRDYETLKRTLRDRAVGGESEKALELYMKWFGAPYMEAERAALESTFADLSDRELVDRTLTLIGEPAVRAWLDGR